MGQPLELENEGSVETTKYIGAMEPDDWSPRWVVMEEWHFLNPKGVQEITRKHYRDLSQPRHMFIWKYRLPLKVRFFTWPLLRHKLMTRERRQRFFPNETTKCVLCTGEIEDDKHIFFYYNFACTVQGIHQLVGDGTSINDFWADMMRGCSGSKVERGRRVTVLWSLWLHCNNIIFRGRSPSMEVVTQDVDNLVAF